MALIRLALESHKSMCLQLTFILRMEATVDLSTYPHIEL